MKEEELLNGAPGTSNTRRRLRTAPLLTPGQNSEQSPKLSGRNRSSGVRKCLRMSRRESKTGLATNDDQILCSV